MRISPSGVGQSQHCWVACYPPADACCEALAFRCVGAVLITVMAARNRARQPARKLATCAHVHLDVLRPGAGVEHVVSYVSCHHRLHPLVHSVRPRLIALEPHRAELGLHRACAGWEGEGCRRLASQPRVPVSASNSAALARAGEWGMTCHDGGHTAGTAPLHAQQALSHLG